MEATPHVHCYSPVYILYLMTATRSTSKISLQTHILMNVSVTDYRRCENKFTIFMAVVLILCLRHVLTFLCDVLGIRILLARGTIIQSAKY
jgi:hypothetical protein